MENKYIKINMLNSALVKITLVLFICLSLKACSFSRDITTEHVRTSSIIKYVSLAFQPTTGKGGVHIELHYNGDYFDNDVLVGLGKSDSFVITSGENVYVIDSIPKLEILMPVTIDTTKEISVEFVRNGEIAESVVVEPNRDLKPKIKVGEFEYNSVASTIPVSFGFGLTTRDDLVGSQTFGYNTETIQCYSSKSRFPKQYAGQELYAIELTRDDYINDMRIGQKFVPMGMSEVIFNHGSDFIISEDAIKLTGSEYDRCETLIYSYIRLSPGSPHYPNKLLQSRTIGRNMSLSITLLSTPELVTIIPSDL